MEKVFLGMLLFVPISLVAQFSGASAIVIFILAALGIVPLAKYIGESTEELAARTNPALGGLLNATFGNATELIIGFFALQAGLIEVVKASLTGSIIGNLLLVTGLAMLAGGWNREKQTFNRTGVLASGSGLFLAVIALVMPAILVSTVPGLANSAIESMSVVVSLALLAMYAAGLLFSLHTHKHLYMEELERYEPKWSVAYSIGVLAIATIFVAWLSEILVGAIEPLVARFGWSELFIGVIFIAIIGNAAEHFSAVSVARKNRMDLSLQVAIGSAVQIAMVAGPVLVFLSLLVGHPMNLVFDAFELIAIFLSVVAINLVIQDGESNWLEGLQLVAAYVIIGIAFFFHP